MEPVKPATQSQPAAGGQTASNSRQTSLDGAPINLKLIRSHAVKELVEIISQVCTVSIQEFADLLGWWKRPKEQDNGF